MMIALLALIVLAAGQNCPYCEYNACQVFQNGLSSCSDCNLGTLVQMTTLPSQSGTQNVEWTVGVCMLCGSNCNACEYGNYSVSMENMQVGIYCTDCASGFVVNGATGACLSCPANCLECQETLDDTYVQCTQCASGYELGSSSNNFACTLSSSSTTALQDGSGSAPGMSGLTIGLICWGAIMTVLSVVFIVLWMRKQEKGASNAGLLGSEIEVTATRT